MKIDFNKIKNNLIDINYSKENTKIVGTLERINKNCVKLYATFSSTINLTCSRCGKEFDKSFEYDLSLLLTNGNYKDKSEIDVVEFFDNKIDIDYLAFSEISSIKEDYNYCYECINSNDILEIEF